MTGTITLPDTITIDEVDPSIDVTIGPAETISPYNPLANDPSQNWTLQTTAGVSSWVEYVPPATQMALGMEDGAGVILLEDGLGVILMEL